MSNILGRTEFYSETANLFTDEKTAQNRAKVCISSNHWNQRSYIYQFQVIEWINQLSFADTQTKCDIVAKIQETVMTGTSIVLIDEFLDSILSLMADPNGDVKKVVVGFVEKLWWVWDI